MPGRSGATPLVAPVVLERQASVRLVPWTALAATGLVAALVAGRPELVVLAAPFALALVVGLASLDDPRCAVGLALDADRVVQGDIVEVEVLLSTTVPFPRVEVVVDLPAGLTVIGAPEGIKTAGTAAVGVALAAGAEARLRWRLRCDHWGAFDVDTVRLRAHHRSGLMAWTAMARRRNRLRVLPSAGSLRDLIEPRRTLATVGNLVSTVKGAGVEFADIRPFQVGDRPRDVNWRATARRGELWVNERYAERNADIVLLLDSFADPSMDSSALVRTGVQAACSLADGYLRNRDRVGVIDLGGLQWLAPALGMAALYRVVDTLVRMGPILTEADRGLWLIPGAAIPPRALVIVITPLLDQRVDGAVIGLRRRRLDVVVIEVDPEPHMTAPAGPFGGSALRLWRLDRDRRRHLLQRLGAVMVRWPQDASLSQVMAEVRLRRRRPGAR